MPTETGMAELPAIFDFWQFTIEELARRRLSLSDEASNRLERFIGDGSVRVLNHLSAQRIDPNSREAITTVKRVQASITTLMDHLERETRGVELIDAARFEAVRLAICPLWPFC